MKQKSIYLALIAVVVLFVAGWTMRAAPVQWEYKFEYNVPEKDANQLGAQGWELIAVSQKNAVSQSFIFKRAK